MLLTRVVYVLWVAEIVSDCFPILPLGQRWNIRLDFARDCVPRRWVVFFLLRFNPPRMPKRGEIAGGGTLCLSSGVSPWGMA